MLYEANYAAILDKIKIKLEFWRTLPISVIACIFMLLKPGFHERACVSLPCDIKCVIIQHLCLDEAAVVTSWLDM